MTTVKHPERIAKSLFALLKMTSPDGPKVTESLLVALAKRINEDVLDDEELFRNLEHAVKTAEKFARALDQPDLPSSPIDEVFAVIRSLNGEGKFEEAASVLEDAYDRIGYEHARLIDAGLEQAILRRDAGDAAKWVSRQVRLTAQGETLFDALCAELQRWYLTGRDKGLTFDLQVALALAQALQEQAANPDQRLTALNDLAIALATLGEREPGTARLEEAVSVYRAALEEYTRDHVPMDWAMTHNNLGNALFTLGQREPGTARLEQAVTAYRAALKGWTRDRVPLQWAMTQSNLGNALRALGEREPGTARLEEAVTAYRAALEERTRDRVPLDWAETQNNLGNALQNLGNRERGTARLEEAITAYRAALEGRTRYRSPLGWAMTQNNLGLALQTLGQREPETARLEQAVFAYRAALEEYKRDRVPLDWAMSHGNMGVAIGVLADRRSDLAMARQALQQIVEAEAQMRAGGHEPFADYFAAQIPRVQAVIDRLS